MTLRYSYQTKPYSHQKRALGKIARLDGKAGLWMPMRTGKTKVAIDWAGIAFHNHGLRRVLIVCPISVIDVWKDEIEKHCPVPSVILTLRETTKQNAETMRELALSLTDEGVYTGSLFPPPATVITWVLVNYEMVWRTIEEVGPRGGKHTKTLDEIIARWQPDLVVADEAHKIKSYTSRQSQALMRLGKVASMRLPMTGTPITKWPLDAYGIFRFMDGDAPPEQRTFEQVKWRCWKKDERGKIHPHDETCEGFADHFANWVPTRYNPDSYEVSTYKNTDELTQRIRAHSFAIRLEDAFPGLPERAPPQDIKVQLSPKARRIYDEMAKEMITEITDAQGNLRIAKADIILTKLVRLSQITSGFIKDEDGVEVDIDDAKQRACMDLVTNMLEQDEKVVVFCRFVHDYHRLSAALTARKIGHAMLTGETKQAERTANIARFRQPSTPVFIAQMQSGSLGIDLSAARLSIFFSLGYNWAEYIQACERTLDPRRPRPLGIYRLLATRTIDIVQRRVIDGRSKMADQIIHRPQSLLDGGVE